jgi:quercetin dioxygenase-like cupin family protein
MELQSPRPAVKTPAAAFTGDVYMTPLFNGTGPSRMTVALVRFTPGAHTDWHSHAVGQTRAVPRRPPVLSTRQHLLGGFHV